MAIKSHDRPAQGREAARQETGMPGKTPSRNVAVHPADVTHVDLDEEAREFIGRLENLSPDELRDIRAFEMQHKNRKAVLEAIHRRLVILKEPEVK